MANEGRIRKVARVQQWIITAADECADAIGHFAESCFDDAERRDWDALANERLQGVKESLEKAMKYLAEMRANA